MCAPLLALSENSISILLERESSRNNVSLLGGLFCKEIDMKTMSSKIFLGL